MKKTFTLHIHGMHCNACVVLTEDELKAHKNVVSAKSNLTTRTVEICGDFGDITLQEIAQELTAVLSQHTLSTEKQKSKVQWSDFNLAIPIAAGFIFLFIVMQKLGLVNLVNTSQVSYGTAFIIGLIASLSTCMAVVGGLVLSISANFAKNGDPVRPQILFHVGRLSAFLILGGTIGALGSAFQLGQTGAFILSFTVAIVLLILGINLLDIFPWAKKFQPTLPSFIGKRVHSLKNINHTLMPFFIGVSTFFLPCGFTQSMQIYTLSTGNFITGALTMFIFALGTLPVLSLLSFSSLSIQTKTQSGIFFKSAGLIVIFFGILNLIGSLVAFGIIPPILNF